MAGEAYQAGDLRCTLFWSGRRVWTQSRLSNLYLFGSALVAVRTTLGAMTEGGLRAKSIDSWLAGQRAAVEADGALPIAELLDRHPDNRLVPWAAVTEARLRKGWLDSRLVLMLDEGEELRWVWTRGDGFRRWLVPNAPFAYVEAALREILGRALTLG